MKKIGPYAVKEAKIKPYDPGAILAADQVAGLILEKVANVQIEHIGSTSIPGCAGKGILDLMLLFQNGWLSEVNSKLEDLGFQPCNHPDPFPKDRPMMVGSYVFMGETYSIHLHILSDENPEIEKLRRFRDRLRLDPGLRLAYVDWKTAIIKSGITDPVTYQKIKGAFIEDILNNRI